MNMNFFAKHHIHHSHILQGQNTENIVEKSAKLQKRLFVHLFLRRTQTQNPLGIAEMILVAVHQVIYSLFVV